ncbi:hypothetical protein M0R89_03725 [Halorussus limi]|uniref:DUF7991 domain-containing protein n=1 Tax=Halorussus limi TaxID=2938695 RepID=A0A8U0HVP3_9EURY|nr:hypothetical protein [Halorussus limi]UPV75185.1 hypothetical protein M0R89_03725 [Halorussus limi]
MVSAATAIGFLLIMVVNTVLAAVAIRFFRLRLSTQWGAVVYTVVFVPLLYVVTTILLSGFVGFGGSGVEDRTTALMLVWAIPFALAVSLEIFWMPAPDEIELPEQAR